LIVDENMGLGCTEELLSDDCNGFRFFKELKLFYTIFLMFWLFGDLDLMLLVFEFCLDS